MTVLTSFRISVTNNTRNSGQDISLKWSELIRSFHAYEQRVVKKRQIECRSTSTAVNETSPQEVHPSEENDATSQFALMNSVICKTKSQHETTRAQQKNTTPPPNNIKPLIAGSVQAEIRSFSVSTDGAKPQSKTLDTPALHRCAEGDR
jgi:hypothetical protein